MGLRQGLVVRSVITSYSIHYTKLYDLLDPPLHEFLPHADAEIEELAKEMGVQAATLKAKVESLHEFNPMLGHRGCRLAITFV